MFCGTLDGNGYSVNNLTIYNENTFYTGLFACVDKEGTVKNLTLENVNLIGTNYIGGIAGYALGSVTDCSVSGAITYLNKNEYKVFLGGVAGRAENNLNGCTANVSITAEQSAETYAGGIAGYYVYYTEQADAALTISAVSALKIASNADVYAGGIFGYIASKTKLANCYATGNVTVSSTFTGVYGGGLVGQSFCSSTLTNCYATGNVTVSSTSTSTGVYGGGLVGQLDGSSSDTLTNCYATGDVTVSSTSTSASVYGGGLVGQFYRSSGTLTNCYSVSRVLAESPSKTYAGALVGYAESVQIVNTHWLYVAESGVEYAVGYSDTLGIPTSVGSTKHTAVEEFYTLANVLNAGQETPVWEHKTVNSLPMLIQKINEEKK